jgi:hypothetical protein
MPAPNTFPNIERYHPNAQASMRESQSLLEDAARRMGITPMAYLEREKGLRKKEEQDKLDAMDGNKSKFMSPEERSQKLNAYKNRRFLELGIGHVPGEA